jgi:hypothetical protein
MWKTLMETGLAVEHPAHIGVTRWRLFQATRRVYDMSTQSSGLRFLKLMAGVLLIAGTSAVLGAEPPSTAHAAPSKETREKMATVHEQMAACLRSDKPIADCHAQAMEHCRSLMGKEGCPMMDMRHGHGPNRMMPHSADKTDEHGHQPQ